MKKLISFSVILTSLFAVDYQIGAGVGAGNGYKFMNVKMEKYLTPQNTIRFEMEATTKTNEGKKQKILLGASQTLSDENSVKTYTFIDAGYQKSENSKNGAVADIGIGASYNVKENVDTFVEVSAIRDIANHKNNYEVLAGVAYKFDSNTEELSSENKTYKPVAPAYAQNVKIMKKKQEPKKLVAVQKVEEKPVEKLDDIAMQDNMIDIDKESSENKVVIAQNSDSNFKFVMHYDRHSRYLQEEDMQHLIEFAEYLQAHPSIKAEIQGYTDNSGTNIENQKLSEKRAKLVYNILLDLGVSKEQLSYKGYGAVDSLKSNTQRANRVIAKLQA